MEGHLQRLAEACKLQNIRDRTEFQDNLASDSTLVQRRGGHR